PGPGSDARLLSRAEVRAVVPRRSLASDRALARKSLPAGAGDDHRAPFTAAPALGLRLSRGRPMPGAPVVLAAVLCAGLTLRLLCQYAQASKRSAATGSSVAARYAG